MNRSIFRTYICVVLLLLLKLNISEASSRYQASYTLNNGLPSNNIHQIFRDSKNMVWLATDAGLFEFDGGGVITRKELEEIYGECVLSICEDNNKNLWFTVANIGLCYYDGHKIQIFKPEELGLTSKIEKVFFNSKNKILLISTSQKVYKVSSKSLQKLALTPFNHNKPIRISHFIQSDDKLLAISKKNQEVLECNFESNQLKLKEQDEYLPIIEFNQFNTTKRQNKLAIINNAFRIRNQNEGDINCEIIDVAQTKTETFYLARYFILGIEYRKVLRVSDEEIEDFSKTNEIEDVFVQSILVDDDENNIWLATKNKGLIHLQNSMFQYFSSSYFHLDDLTISDIETDDNGFIYIATNNEIIYFKENKIQKRISTTKLCSIIQGCKSSVCEERIEIFDILNNGRNKLWLATNMGFYTLNLQTDAIKYMGICPAQKFIFNKQNELCCFWDNKFTVYSGKNFQDQIFSYHLPDLDAIEISSMTNHHASVWFSTKQIGVFRYESKKIEHFHKNNSGIHNIINDILILPDNNIILGGNNGYIYKAKYQKNSLNNLRTINHNNKLQGNSIQGFQYLRDGSLWCGTNEGVYRFDYQSWDADSTINYLFWNHTKGYYDRSGKNSVIDKDENIWIRTNTQLLKITTSFINELKHNVSSLSLKELHIHNKQAYQDSINICHWTKKIIGPIELSYKQNDLTFTYGFQNCMNPGKNIFRYQLVNFDKNWSDWSSSNQAVYSNLPSGEYILNIQGKHLNKVNIAPLSMRISIANPWWKEAWFFIVTFILIFSLLILSMRLYTCRIRQQEEDRNKINTNILGLKMKTLQNQLDPHFLFNALNSIQGYILEEEIENALDYLSDFSTVLRKNINNADKDYITLADEITYLKHYVKLEQMRFMNQFLFEIVLSKEINPYNYAIPPMLIQPFIESAIKFGISSSNGDGLILINFDLENNNYIRCTIEDNGIGRSKSKEYDAESRKFSHEKTMGIIQERISLLNKINNNTQKYDYKVFDLYDETQNAIGTKIEIGLPFRKTNTE